MRYFTDLLNKRFGRLTVLKRIASRKGASHWLCLCDCGKYKKIKGQNLINKRSTSCGCYQREKTSERFRLELGFSTKKEVYNEYKRNAKKRNLGFNITFEQFLVLSNQNCYYCGLRLNNVRKSRYRNGDFKYNGLDRIDNSKGYTLGNVYSCCARCNKAKGNQSYDSFIEWITGVYNNYGKHV